MLLTWCSTVLGLMYSAWAIARLLWPAAISRSTSTSRPVTEAVDTEFLGGGNDLLEQRRSLLAVAGAVQGQQRPGLPLAAHGDHRPGLESAGERRRVLEAADGLLGVAEGKV
jgi:hypothetical protein